MSPLTARIGLLLLLLPPAVFCSSGPELGGALVFSLYTGFVFIISSTLVFSKLMADLAHLGKFSGEKQFLQEIGGLGKRLAQPCASVRNMC